MTESASGEKKQDKKSSIEANKGIHRETENWFSKQQR